MANTWIPWCGVCGAPLDPNTKLCTNPNCPNSTASKDTTTTTEA